MERGISLVNLYKLRCQRYSMFIPAYFELYELVPPNIYSRYHKESMKVWAMFDERMLITLQNLRVRYGKIIMNDWYWEGKWKERGWRPWNTLTGAQLSQHKWGRAGDLIPVETDAETVRQDILKDPFHPDFEYITCLEMNISWLHFDVRNHDKKHDGVLLVYP